jgi:hypothetical protein
MFGRNYPKLHAQYALRKLFFDTLNDQIAGAIVYDNVTMDTPKPFVKIGDCRGEIAPNEDKDYYRDNFYLKVEVYTEYGGSMQCAQILGEVVDVISKSILAGTFCFGESSPFRLAEFDTVDWEQLSAIDEEEEQAYVQYGAQIVQIVPT